MRRKKKEGPTKYLIEVPGYGLGSFWLHKDWYQHNDILTMDSTKQQYIVWDPWYNRFARWLLGGHHKELKIYHDKAIQP